MYYTDFKYYKNLTNFDFTKKEFRFNKYKVFKMYIL